MKLMRLNHDKWNWVITLLSLCNYVFCFTDVMIDNFSSFLQAAFIQKLKLQIHYFIPILLFEEIVYFCFLKAPRPIRNDFSLRTVWGKDNYKLPCLPLSYLIPKYPLKFQIEPNCWLIENSQGRITDKWACETHFFQVSSREMASFLVLEFFGNIEFIHQMINLIFSFKFGEFRLFKRAVEMEVFFDG